MTTSTREIIQAALRGDDSVPAAVVDRIIGLLEGKASQVSQGTKDSTRMIVHAALQADESVSQAIRESVLGILAGAIESKAKENLTLVTMTEAARKLGRSRTWFWKKVKRESNRPGAAFPPVEISPGEFRYRLRDLEAFAARTVPYVPIPHQKNKKSKGEN